MKTGSIPDKSERKVAFFWDESLLWGLMACKALRSCGLTFDLVSAEGIKAGRLKNFRALFVPGGWAAHKLERLGHEGASAVRQFVKSGGSYLGICGGAGLATMDGLGLLKVGRKPTSERVPSFSGRICLDLMPHPIWAGLVGDEDCGGPARGDTSHVFHAWWPSQFSLRGEEVEVLAVYGEALSDAYSSDLNVGEVMKSGKWAEVEAAYGINLDPARLKGEPAVIGGMCGKGKVILSLIHFDTAGDSNGAAVLANLWHYLGGEKPRGMLNVEDREYKYDGPVGSRFVIEDMAVRLHAEVEDVIAAGMKDLLWFRRTEELLQWKRGVRGLEYCTLYNMIREIRDSIRRLPPAGSSGAGFEQKITGELEYVRNALTPFLADSRRLIALESLSRQGGPGSGARPAGDPAELTSLRKDLFSHLKRHGGRFKELIDKIDKVLVMMLLKENGQSTRTSP